MGILISFLIKIINLFELVIIVEALLSWVIQDRTNEIMNILRTITNPILEPFRRLQYRFFGNSPIDVSPILALFALQILSQILTRLFFRVY